MRVRGYILPLASVSLLLLGTTTAHSQLMPERQMSADTAEVRSMLQKFARCLVRSSGQRAIVARVILEDVSNQDIRRKFPSLVDSVCLPMGDAVYDNLSLALPGDYFRYVVAEELVKAELQQPVADFSAVPLLQHQTRDPSAPVFKDPKQFAAARESEQERVFASKFGECVARSDPIASYNLLFTKPSSAEEAAVFAALSPVLGSCLVPGQKIKIGKSMVRGTIALNYFRLERAARADVRVTSK